MTQKHDIIISRPLGIDGLAMIPMRLRFEALWIYDMTLGKILKNKTGDRIQLPLDAVEVGASWLTENGYGRPFMRPALLEV
jgi:hypothetical protein